MATAAQPSDPCVGLRPEQRRPGASRSEAGPSGEAMRAENAGAQAGPSDTGARGQDLGQPRAGTRGQERRELRRQGVSRGNQRRRARGAIL